MSTLEHEVLLSELTNPEAIVVARSGAIYLASHDASPGDAGKVSVVDPVQRRLTVLVEVPIAPVDMLIEPNDNIYLMGSSKTPDAKSLLLLPVGNYENVSVVHRNLGETRRVARGGTTFYFTRPESHPIQKIVAEGQADDLGIAWVGAGLSSSTQYLYFVDSIHRTIGRICRATGNAETAPTTVADVSRLHFNDGHLYYLTRGTSEASYRDGTLNRLRITEPTDCRVSP